MKDNQNRHLKDLNSCEWDFTDIPQKELRLAEIYEYSRECEEVSNAFTNWLDSPAVSVSYTHLTLPTIYSV